MDITTTESYDYLFKLLCVGESNVGKTTFLHQYIHDNFANFRSTVGIDVFEKNLIHKNNQRVLLQLWDTAGQERYRSLTRSMFRDSMGFLLVFDVTNESSFLTIQEWLTFIDSFSRVDDDLRPPILLIGNKIDLVTRRIINTIQAEKLANELQITYIETSAVTGVNVQETLHILIEHIFEYMDRSMQKYHLKQISLITLTTEQKYGKGIISIKLRNKASREKKQSCLCT